MKKLHLPIPVSLFAGLAIIFAILLVSVPAPVLAQGPAGAALRATLPFEEVGYLDGVKFKIRVPSNWNGTLLIYMQGSKQTAPPPAPIVAPPVLGASMLMLEETLFSKGYALAASEVGTMEAQFKEEVQDSFSLTSYFRGRVGDPKRTLLWGSSLGGFTATRMIEDYPRSFDGAIATCSTNMGQARRFDFSLDYALAYAVAFGWPAEWGSVGDLREGLDVTFYQDVAPKVVLPDDTTVGRWEFIRLVMGMPPESFWQTDPMYNAPGMFMNIWSTTAYRASVEAVASGPIAQNLNHRYTLKPEEKTYLADMGVDADQLLARMNAQTNIEASPRAREYVERYGGLRGKPGKPLITLHNTLDCQADVRSERLYRDAVAESGATEYLLQTYVKGPGHCDFTASQLLTVLAAMERWLDTGVKPGASFFPEADGFDNTFVPAPWPF